MSYRSLPLTCFCGEVPERILEVGFTSDRHMVIHYWCATCNRVLFVSHTLEECEERCPPAVNAAPHYDHAAEDARFLHSLGISIAP